MSEFQKNSYITGIGNVVTVSSSSSSTQVSTSIQQTMKPSMNATNNFVMNAVGFQPEYLSTNSGVMTVPMTSGTSTTPSPPLNNELLFGQRMSGMRRASNLSEWQLQAVLYKAKLTQYFETFISQGGDDIDQIMQCDEQEFLEIMSLVGMASKPLHVRRLQRTLNEFSLNRAQFLLNATALIGLPPMDLACSASTTDNLAAALQFLIPGFLPGQLDLSCFTGNMHSDSNQNFGLEDSTQNLTQKQGSLINRNESIAEIPSTSSSSSSASLLHVIGATANVLPFPDNVLMSLVNASSISSPTENLTPVVITSSGTQNLASNTTQCTKSNSNKHMAVENAINDSQETFNSPPLTSTSLALSQIFQQCQSSSSQTKNLIETNSSQSDAVVSQNERIFATSVSHLPRISPPPNTMSTDFSKIQRQPISPTESISQTVAPSTSSYATGSFSTLTSSEENVKDSNNYKAPEVPIITQEDIQQLAKFARVLCDTLPKIEPRFVQNKKKISKELLDAMSLPPNHPQRFLLFRRFSAIYGRFDAKRKPDKALTFHEALVNEAAAQLGLCRPELLTRRDELFPLARKLVRLAGFCGLGSSSSRFHNHEVSDSHSAVGNKSDYSRTSSRSSIGSHSGSLSPSPTSETTPDGISNNEHSTNNPFFESIATINSGNGNLTQATTDDGESSSAVTDLKYLTETVDHIDNEAFNTKLEELSPSSPKPSVTIKKRRVDSPHNNTSMIVQKLSEELGESPQS